MNVEIDKTLQSLDVTRVDALQISMASFNPVEDQTDRKYRLRTTTTSPTVSQRAVAALQQRLDRRDSPALVHEISNVYIQTTHWMLLSSGKLVKETCYLIHDQHVVRNLSMISEQESIKLDPSRIWVLGSNYAPGNYWHWHSQSLPAILHCLETIPEERRNRASILTTILEDWQLDGLLALGLKRSQVVQIPRGKTAYAVSILYSDLLSSKQVFGVNRMRVEARNLLRTNSIGRGVTSLSESPSRIYVSRGDSNRRNLLNESDLSASLSRMGFVAISNSQYSIAEQIQMYQRADIVVAPHGAGSTNLLHMRTGSSFVEFQQASHINAGPLSLGKVSRITPYIEAFADDGLGQATTGWQIDISRALHCVELAISEVAVE